MQDDDASARLASLIDQSPDLLPEKDRHIFLGHFPLEVRLAEPLREIPRFINTHPLLFDLLATQRLFAHMPPTARYVLPHCSLAHVPPHQDISYNRHMGEFLRRVGALVPIDSACGGMAVYPRTQYKEEMVGGSRHLLRLPTAGCGRSRTTRSEVPNASSSRRWSLATS